MAREYAGPAGGVDALTMLGRVVRVRPVRPDDEAAIVDLHARLSPDSRYLRFLSAGAAAEVEARRLSRPPDGRHLALAVIDAGRVVGVASYERASGTTADVAVLVDDARHGEGIGTLVLEHLAAAARRAGIEELTGDVLAANTAMLRISADFGSGVRRTLGADRTTMRVRVPTLPDEEALAAMGARDRVAERRSLRPLLAPASVAVVGAGQPDGAGRELLRALVAGGYTGEAYPVDPYADEVAGLAAYPSMAAIGSPVDLAVVAVPAHDVVRAVADCARARVGAAVVLTAGHGDRGPPAADLVRLARTHGFRLVGPDRLAGMLNTDPAVRLTATLAARLPPAGGLAVAAQSGAVGVAMLDAAARTGIGISSFVSLGEQTDVSGNDLLAYWYDDPATRAVALHLESLRNAGQFARVAQALTRRKPVLAVDSGRPPGARREEPAPPTVVESLYHQAGIVRTGTLGELLDAARMLVDQPLPAGNRLAVVGNAGGLNLLAAGVAEPAGLTVPRLSAPVRAALTAVAPDVSGVGNPVDLAVEAAPATLGTAVGTVAASGEVDAIVTTFVATRTNDPAGALAALAAAADDAPGLPVAAVVAGATDVPAVLGSRRVPVFALCEGAVRAVGHAAGYAVRRREPPGRLRLSTVEDEPDPYVRSLSPPPW
jgi:acyl-CoA synthetase (NDP forming)/L-amino acid N-acyltransferase YncA